MREIVKTNTFDKDLKRCSKRGLDISALIDIVGKLANDEPLNAKHRPHQLKNNYSGWNECHIKPDWLLIYQYNNENNELILSRTGTHSDLF